MDERIPRESRSRSRRKSRSRSSSRRSRSSRRSSRSSRRSSRRRSRSRRRRRYRRSRSRSRSHGRGKAKRKLIYETPVQQTERNAQNPVTPAQISTILRGLISASGSPATSHSTASTRSTSVSQQML